MVFEWVVDSRHSTKDRTVTNAQMRRIRSKTGPSLSEQNTRRRILKPVGNDDGPFGIFQTLWLVRRDDYRGIRTTKWNEGVWTDACGTVDEYWTVPGLKTAQRRSKPFASPTCDERDPRKPTGVNRHLRHGLSFREGVDPADAADAGVVVDIWHITVSVNDEWLVAATDQSLCQTERCRRLSTAAFATRNCEHGAGLCRLPV